jgi:hypothetical protein
MGALGTEHFQKTPEKQGLSEKVGQSAAHLLPESAENPPMPIVLSTIPPDAAGPSLDEVCRAWPDLSPASKQGVLNIIRAELLGTRQNRHRTSE